MLEWIVTILWMLCVLSGGEEVWMNEVRAYLKAHLVFASLIKNVDFVGKKGDVLHIPDVSQLTVYAKAANTQVTLQSPTETEFTLTINQHWESSFVREDILTIQAAYDLRQLYTESAGYAIAEKVDTDIGSLQSGLTNRVIGSTGAAVNGPPITNATDIADIGLRQAIELLDTARVPAEGRALVIHPAQKNVMFGISKFTEYQMIGPGGMPIRSGMFGEIYGIPVYVTTQTAAVATSTHANMLFHKNAFMLASQLSPRVQSDYILEYLGWLTVVDHLYGFAEYRDSHAIAIFSPV